MNTEKSYYSLGASATEQQRLEEQQHLYGDAKFITFNETNTVCEVGCGAGANLWIASKLRHGKFLGIDIQAEQVAAARQKAKQLSLTNTEFYLADGRELPLPSNTADVTFCRLVLIHLPDPLPLLREMYRITRPGGKIIAIEPEVTAYDTSKPALMKCFKTRVEYIYGPGRGSLDVARNLQTLFNQCGLKNVALEKHEIRVTGQEKDTLAKLLLNWLIMNNSAKETMLRECQLTAADFDQAEQEITEITASDYIYQPLWIAQGIK